jgi:DNA-binding transcriptional MerR regulator
MLKVGEVTKRTGISTRRLHHYDQIGLLKPSMRAENDYRLYSKTDLVRLQKILSLQQVGFSLEK